MWLPETHGVYVQELFLPASPAKNETSVTKRILDYYKFMNSKTLYDEVTSSTIYQPLKTYSFLWQFYREAHVK